MNLSKKIIIILSLIVIVSIAVYSLFFPFKQFTEQKKEAYIIVQDMIGRNVNLSSNIQKVVTTVPDTLRLVVMLNATDKIVGITSYVDMGYANKLEDILAHPELLNSSIARIGAAAEINIEKIAEIKPDVVLLYAPYSYLADQIEQKAKVPVVCVSAGSSPQEFYKALRLVAKILDKEEQAEKIIAYFETKIQDVTNRIPKNQSAPKVYLADWAYRYGVGWTTSQYWPLDITGAINVAKEVEKRFNTTYFEVSKEQIIQWNPDIIFIHGYKGRTSAEAIINDPALQSIKAVRDRKVYGVFGPYIGYDPKTWIIDMYHIAKTIYPDNFKDIDIIKIGEDVFKFFYGDNGPLVFHQVLINRGIYLSPELDFSKK
ncbi:MAG: ABC transporter substrate-binding protein [Candidatus Verstraetearchaeota archaeon]|nr:ABC transporter substrate-binding protein [Candidatus Verstraetearchaeota archaeon]